MSTQTKEAATLEVTPGAAEIKKAGTKSQILRVLFYLLVAVIIVFNLFRFVWALLSSFRPSNERFSTQLLPTALTMDHYAAVFKDPRFVNSLINSVVIAGCT